MSSSTENVHVPQYLEVIEHFFLTNEIENHNLLHFYNLNTEFVISNTHQWDVKSIWKKRFFEVAKQLNKDIIRDAPEPDWEDLKRLVFEYISKKSKPAATKKRKISGSETSSTSTTTKASSSGSSTNTVKSLTPASYHALSTTFSKLSDSKKWKLEDGVYVEDLLYDYAKSRKNENLSHSFVINVKDSQLKEKFKEHWHSVTSKNAKTLPIIPDDLSSHLLNISTLKSYKEIDSLNSYCYYTQKNLYVSTACLKLVTNTYRNQFFSRGKILEDDILVNIWVIVDQVINSYNLQAKRSEPSSVSSTARRNRDRNIDEMQRKKVGRKSDLIICNDSGLELGCGEAGLSGEEFDTKVIVESSLKTPKVMHDMFVRLCSSVDNKQEVIKELQVVGLVFSRFRVRMLIMDCPNGYACRLRGTTTAVFSGKEESLGSDFCKAYQLIWKAKEVCKETESIVQNYMSTVEINFESDNDSSDDDKVHLPDSLRSPKRD